jgi:DMSO/TMAO reductase YedYZ molybdopterin-dependent catalytic subunit
MDVSQAVPEAGKPIGRRVVLGMIGLGGAGILTGARIQSVLSRWLAPVFAADPTGLSDLIPVAGRFRIYSVVGFLPRRSTTAYRLQVGGLVERPLDLSYADLIALPATRVVHDFQCVTGWRVAQVPWTGVQLREVLDRAGVKPEGKALTFTSFDGQYTESLTLDQARRSDVLVAYRLQDSPISADHGGPVRLYVAPMYGYKSCKWLARIDVTDAVQPGYWEERGYDVDAWVGRSNGRDDHATS